MGIRTMSMPSFRLLIGDATITRYFAMISDNLLAFIGAAWVASRFGALGDILPNIVLFVSYFVYFLLTEGLLSTTPGKFLCGLCVRTLSGGRCSWAQAAIRTVFRFVEANPILLGALPGAITVLVTRRHQRLGDLLAGTVVVSSSEEKIA
ncbi:MAG: RDD family protein [Planctomycetes bacterium]|nr:RDD family protein [Planctomycetota bacterium]